MKIIIVGMINSIHLARWIKHLHKFKKIEVYIFPVFPENSHPILRNISSINSKYSNIKIIKLFSWEKLNTFFFKILKFFFDDNFLIKWLNYNINKLKPKYIHSHELTTSSILCMHSKSSYQGKYPKWIVTNWGSDLFFFFKRKKFKNNLKKILKYSNFYTAECQRDFLLARKIGSKAQFLDCILNSGGVDLKFTTKLRQKKLTSLRKVIIIKGYQGLFGLALNSIKALEKIHKELKDYKIVIYSADNLVINYCKTIRNKLHLEIYSNKDYLSERKIYNLFAKSKIYIGLSKSDGVSTSLIESMALGAFPIQSDTSCAKEWIVNNKSGFIVKPDDISQISKKILFVLNNNKFINYAASINKKTIAKKADSNKVKMQIRSIYL